MERSWAVATPSGFVNWEELHELNDRGRREVRYYLKRKDGTSDLAVVGKEKSLKPMSYRYAIRNRSLLSFLNSPSLSRLRSRRDVIDLLNSIVPDFHSHQSSQSLGHSSDSHGHELDEETTKGMRLKKAGQWTTEFLWLGSPYCRKRRMHYQSFSRNGVKISVHDFVYVLAEEDKRLIAYLDDMYEDSRGNKMVVVRWFHKIDEVGITLPLNYNDKEIFFSLCRQDLSIECVDGLATVLAPQHYEKFLNVAKHTQLEPFVCHRLFDNDDVKPFDMTQLKGYGDQDILKYIPSTVSSSKFLQANHDQKVEGHVKDTVGTRPKKRLRRSKEYDKQEMQDSCLDMQNLGDSVVGSKEGCLDEPLYGNFVFLQKHPEYLTVGSQVEVLSEDSGLRGCWFRAQIVKRSKEKVKVRYQDVKDADDETKNLEEWVLASKVAAVFDELDLRTFGRKTIRPSPLSSKGLVSLVFNVGTIVDVWWHDAWWEGIVVLIESEDEYRVYFPGEKRDSVFRNSNLRYSQEWMENGWNDKKEKPELVPSILSALGLEETETEYHPDDNLDPIKFEDWLLPNDESRSSPEGNLLSESKWKWSGKKKRHRHSVRKFHCGTQERFSALTGMEINHDNGNNCTGDSLFCSSVVSAMPSLIMSS